MSSPAVPTLSLDGPLRRAWRPLPHLMRGVWLQALRRNETFVLFILLGLYGLAAGVIRLVGIDSAHTARFVAGLGLQLGSLLATLLVVLMGARQVAVEIEQRTIYPILARPLTRMQFLLGKALPVALLGIGSLTAFTLITLLLTPRLPDQVPLVLAQVWLLKSAALLMLTVLVALASMVMPTALAMLVSGFVALAGTPTLRIAASLAPGDALAGWLTGLLPDFRLLDQMTRYIEGGAPLPAPDLLNLLGYGVLWTAILFAGAVLAFRRRPL